MERDGVIEGYLPLVRKIARRFAGRGEPLEDLVQVGSLALVSAVDRCDPARADRLSAYVATCVEGEIRRHLRDRCAVVRIPRRIQQDAALASTLRNPLPIVDELLKEHCESLDDATLARAMVTRAAQSLDVRERRLVALHYYGDLSQSEIGSAEGLSQVQVSRLLRRAIDKMRARLD
jgi:RNA polymerase sigma-B factor